MDAEEDAQRDAVWDMEVECVGDIELGMEELALGDGVPETLLELEGERLGDLDGVPPHLDTLGHRVVEGLPDTDGGVEIENVIMAVAVLVVVVEEDTVFEEDNVMELRGEMLDVDSAVYVIVAKLEIDKLGFDEGELDIN